MTTITEKITVHSDEGLPGHPASLDIVLDGSDPNVPVEFWADNKCVFSMGSAEVDDFCKALKSVACDM